MTSNKLFSSNEIDEFIAELRLDPDEKVSRLSEGVQQAVFLKSISKKEGLAILICTAGMYLDALKVTYKTIKDILDNGGACLELTYPAYEDDELDKYLGVKPQVINL